MKSRQIIPLFTHVTRLLLFFILFVLVFPHANAYSEDVAIIVNKRNPLNTLSFNALVKIFRQERQYWDSGRKIYMIMHEMKKSERDLVLKKIYRMKGEKLKKYWLSRIFKGDISTFPTTLRSNAAVKRFVSKVPNSIALISSSNVDETVKVLKIDGKMPGDAGYILSDKK